VEFQEIPPIRHKEDELNEILATYLDYGIGNFKMEDLRTANLKAFLLLQAKLQGKMESLPIQDYHTDCKQVLDVASRLSPALIEICTVAKVAPSIIFAALQLNSQLVAVSNDSENGRDSRFVSNIKKSDGGAVTIESAQLSKSQKTITCSIFAKLETPLRCWLLVFLNQSGEKEDKQLLAVERVIVSTSSKQFTLRLRESQQSNSNLYKCCVKLEVDRVLQTDTVFKDVSVVE
jgi:hypothetical protein